MTHTAEHTHSTEQPEVLREACRYAGLEADGATLIRDAENALWRLRGGVVARISRPGHTAAASREVAVAHWLAAEGIPAIEPASGTASGPYFARKRAVTFWKELPAHRQGTPAETGRLLRQLHALPIPDLDPPLPQVEPFVQLENRIATIAPICDQERQWLRAHLAHLAVAWNALPDGRPLCVVHGDAWAGNVAVGLVDSQPRLLDFERTTVGPPEWDLTSTAVGVDLFDHVSRSGYEEFCSAYGADVTEWAGYPTLRDIRELRVTLYALQVATDYPKAVPPARLRLESLQGLHGPRPWNWPVVP